MEYLVLENLSKSYGEKVLFSNISFTMNKSDKIAFVAKNGSGKSTLMRVIAGQEAAEGENVKIQFRKGIKVGILDQDPSFRDGHTILDAVLESDNELVKAVKDYQLAQQSNDGDALQAALIQMDTLQAWDFEAKIKEILFKLNIEDLGQHVAELSGGQVKRLALAKIIIEEPEFLILDEPTNHLDLEMIEWLENYLSRPNITLLMVTHDRYFLERVCNNIVELDGGNLYKHKGNYSDFLEKKMIREEIEDVVLDKNKKLLKKELEWVRRMPSARTTKSKSRTQAFYQLKEETYGKKKNEQLQIEIKGQRMGSKILEAQYITKAYDDLVIVKDFDYKFKKKERVGIVGPNGVGKTTFLKLLTKEIRPDAGKVVVGGTIHFGYYTQNGIQLHEDKPILEAVRDIAEYIPLEKGMKLTASQLLERFMFSRKQQMVYVSQLSGGERRRLHLLMVLMTNPNFLILDEPTNDLDIVTLNVLEDFLMDFPGCVIIVSHDRYFMDKIVDHLFIFEGEGKIRDFNGTYSEYRVKKIEEDKQAKIAERSNQPKASTTTSSIEETHDGQRKLNYEERKEFKRLEKEIEKLENKKASLVEKFNDTSLSPDDIQKYAKELSETESIIEDKEMRWMELAEFV